MRKTHWLSGHHDELRGSADEAVYIFCVAPHDVNDYGL